MLVSGKSLEYGLQLANDDWEKEDLKKELYIMKIKMLKFADMRIVTGTPEEKHIVISQPSQWGCLRNHEAQFSTLQTVKLIKSKSE